MVIVPCGLSFTGEEQGQHLTDVLVIVLFIVLFSSGSRTTLKFKCVAPINVRCFGRCTFLCCVIIYSSSQQQIATAAAVAGQCPGVRSLLEVAALQSYNHIFTPLYCLPTEGNSSVGFLKSQRNSVLNTHLHSRYVPTMSARLKNSRNMDYELLLLNFVE